jgi:hypothetical protein
VTHSRRVAPWLIAAACLVISLVGLYHAFFYSWLVTASIDMPATAKAHYDSLARLIGTSSLVLLGLTVTGACWLLFKKRS